MIDSVCKFCYNSGISIDEGFHTGILAGAFITIWKWCNREIETPQKEN